MRIREVSIIIVLVTLLIAAPAICGGDNVKSPLKQQEVIEKLKGLNASSQGKNEKLHEQALKKKQARMSRNKKTDPIKRNKEDTRQPVKIAVPQLPIRPSQQALTMAKLLAKAKKNAHGITVMPEVPTVVVMSNTDVNRITSSEDIKDVVYSKEKGLSVQFSGKDCYVKFQAVRKGEDTVYSTLPSELFIVSGGRVYNIIAVPRAETIARTIRLSEGERDKIKANSELFSGMPLEKKVISMIQYAYQDNIPYSFTVTNIGREIKRIEGIKLVLLRSVIADGEGIRLKIYQAEISPGSQRKGTGVDLDERNFLQTDLTTDTIAVAIEKPHLEKDDQTRIYICEINREEAGDKLSTTVAKPSK
ncbi:MAG: type-F conjugative transfer system secretin TraK [Deltaproteobacteria bacterium]|nr:type-F conjugative transfer system secretin TraK [Deltaproteobacteria bacterium]